MKICNELQLITITFLITPSLAFKGNKTKSYSNFRKRATKKYQNMPEHKREITS